MTGSPGQTEVNQYDVKLSKDLQVESESENLTKNEHKKKIKKMNYFLRERPNKSSK